MRYEQIRYFRSPIPGLLLLVIAAMQIAVFVMRVGEVHPTAYAAMFGGAVTFFCALIWWSTPYATVSMRYLTLNRNFVSTTYVKLADITSVDMEGGDLVVKRKDAGTVVFRKAGFKSRSKLEAFYAQVKEVMEEHYIRGAAPDTKKKRTRPVDAAVRFSRSLLLPIITLAIAGGLGACAVWMWQSQETFLFALIPAFPAVIGIAQGGWWLHHPYVTIDGEQVTVHNHLLDVKSVMLPHVHQVDRASSGVLKLTYRGSSIVPIRAATLGGARVLDSVAEALSSKIAELKTRP